MILDFADRRALQIETEVFYSGEAFYRSIKEQCPYDRGILCISTQNNCSEKRQTSETSEKHGFGLKNIRKIAEKYHGSLTTRIQEWYLWQKKKHGII